MPVGLSIQKVQEFSELRRAKKGTSIQQVQGFVELRRAKKKGASVQQVQDLWN
jgi:hypothetical protein